MWRGGPLPTRRAPPAFCPTSPPPTRTAARKGRPYGRRRWRISSPSMPRRRTRMRWAYRSSLRYVHKYRGEKTSQFASLSFNSSYSLVTYVLPVRYSIFSLLIYFQDVLCFYSLRFLRIHLIYLLSYLALLVIFITLCLPVSSSYFLVSISTSSFLLFWFPIYLFLHIFLIILCCILFYIFVCACLLPIFCACLFSCLYVLASFSTYSSMLVCFLVTSDCLILYLPLIACFSYFQCFTPFLHIHLWLSPFYFFICARLLFYLFTNACLLSY